MPVLPKFDPTTNVNDSPHLVILGAGASVAACPQGDRNGRVLPVMSSLVDVVGLRDILATSGIVGSSGDFEQIYDRLAKSPESAHVIKEVEERVRAYFLALELPDKPTLYDQIILSLRPKDLVATFNWDPLLVQAYRRNTVVRELPKLAFLHGNVGIRFCLAHHVEGYAGTLCEQCYEPLTPTSLLYPVAEKDYSGDPFIKSAWSRMRKVLQTAYFVTIFGYRAPKSDAAARQLMQEVWEANQTRVLTQIEIIDTSSEPEVRENWDEFLDDLHYAIFPALGLSWQMKHTRRSCETLAAATLLNNPWPDRPMPQFESLAALQDWVRPLVQEEIRHQGSGTGFQVPAPLPIRL